MSRLLPLEPSDKVALRFGPPGRTVELDLPRAHRGRGCPRAAHRRVRAGGRARDADDPHRGRCGGRAPRGRARGAVEPAAGGAGGRARAGRRRARARCSPHRVPSCRSTCRRDRRRHRPGPRRPPPGPSRPQATRRSSIYTSGTTGPPKGAVLSRRPWRPTSTGSPRRGRGRPTTCSPTPCRCSTSTGWCSACSARFVAAAPCTTSARPRRGRALAAAGGGTMRLRRADEYHRLAEALDRNGPGRRRWPEPGCWSPGRPRCRRSTTSALRSDRPHVRRAVRMTETLIITAAGRRRTRPGTVGARCPARTCGSSQRAALDADGADEGGRHPDPRPEPVRRVPQPSRRHPGGVSPAVGSLPGTSATRDADGCVRSSAARPPT